MKYSLFGNDELGWTIARQPGKKKVYFLSFDRVTFGRWMPVLDEDDLTTKEKAEAKLKELQDEK